MERTLKYLKSVFGTGVRFCGCKDLNNMPMYISENYIIEYMVIKNSDVNYVLVKEKNKTHNINKLKKQEAQLSKYTKRNVIFVFDNITAPQRNALIGSGISFIVPDTQIYIPGKIINITEKFEKPVEYGNEFQKATQVVFAYLLINNVKEFNAHSLAEKINYSVITINRSIRELVYRQLLIEKGKGTRKTYEMIDRKKYWEKGKQYLFNPCVKQYYVKWNKRHDGRIFYSNETALFRLSTEFDESYSRVSFYAVSQKEFAQYNRQDILNEYEVFDNNYGIIEKFKYDPAMLSNSNYVDVVSLYAQFKDIQDERTEIALDELIGEMLNG